MKKIIMTLILNSIWLFGYSQTDCEKEFTGDDVYRWRNDLLFKPKYAKLDKFDYTLLNLSGKAYRQMHIEISVRCGVREDKDKQVVTMWYFWDKKIPQATLDKYFPAYYVFYQVDKSAFGN